MLTLDATAVEAALAFPSLIERLRTAFAAGATVPLRHHHAVPVPGGSDGTLLLMPAWREGGHLGIKIVTVFPDNAAVGLPSVIGSYVLMSAATGAPLAMIEGRTLTLRRTAAASALAASYLARADAARLLMVGTGALAPNLIRAHVAVRPIREVTVWGRDPAKAEALVRSLDLPGVRCRAASDLPAAVAAADIVSCATLARAPLVSGDWLAPGSHLDLVGGFTPDMRETDDAAIRRASLFVDTRTGAFKEAGDIVAPLRSGLITEQSVRGDLFDLARGAVAGRSAADEITLFKSVGTALEDLAAAELVYERSRG